MQLNLGGFSYVVDAGDLVGVGAVLATMESPEARNALEREKAELSRLRVDMEGYQIVVKQVREAKRQLVDLASVRMTAAVRETRRSDRAFGLGAMSEIDYEKAKDDRVAAELSYRHAAVYAELEEERLSFVMRGRELELEKQRVVVENLERRVAELVIRSPVEGVVGDRLVEEESVIAGNQAVLTVVDLSTLEVSARVPESYTDALDLGLNAEIHVNDSVQTAKVVGVSPPSRRRRSGNSVGFRWRYACWRSREPAAYDEDFSGAQGRRAAGAAWPIRRVGCGNRRVRDRW